MTAPEALCVRHKDAVGVERITLRTLDLSTYGTGSARQSLTLATQLLAQRLHSQAPTKRNRPWEKMRRVLVRFLN